MSRIQAERHGRWAEAVTIIWLVITGHRILARHWKCRFGEIDIIAKSEDQLIFIEVKYRQTATATAFPSKQQQQRICKAAAYFLKASHLSMETPCRFGFVLLQMQPTIQFNYIQHQKHAWSC